MTKSIHTLIPDIYDLVGKTDGWFTEDLARELGIDVSLKLSAHFGTLPQKPTLRLSGMGPRCPKALWHSIHTPEQAEPLPPWAKFKYAYGHLIEAMALALAKAAGHEVVGEQDELIVDGIRGHRDAVIDGYIVDVKSTSTFGFQKFKDKSIAQTDSFGYMDQLDAYLVGSADDDLVRYKDVAYDWAIDKTLGHMCLYEHKIRRDSIIARIRTSKEVVGLASPPACTCGTKQEGKSGNISLDTKASYSLFKHSCFPHLRTFLYASGPVYLTRVVRTPDVPEINKQGLIVSSFRS